MIARVIGRLLCRLGLRLQGARTCARPVRLDDSNKVATMVASDRPLIDLDHDAFSSAIAMLKALKTDDREGFNVLAKHADLGMLLMSLCCLASDALAESPSDDLAEYVDRLFTRLNPSPQ